MVVSVVVVVVVVVRPSPLLNPPVGYAPPPVLRSFFRPLSPLLHALEPLAGGPVELEGQRLDPDVHVVLAAARRLGATGIEDRAPADARAYAARMLALLDVAPIPMARVIDTTAPSDAGNLPVRVYEPRVARRALVVFLHGGGGVIGSVASYDRIARLIAQRTGATVASVDYRLAPEHPFPAAIDDAVAAWRWAAGYAAARNLARTVVTGDSFGGYLAAWIGLRARAAGLAAPSGLALMYPLTDLTMSHRSHETFAEGFLLTARTIHWFRNHYIPDADARRGASPLFADDGLVAATPPTAIVTAGFDPLRDEGHAWGERLAAAGVPVTVRCERDQVHGFLGMAGAFPRAAAAVARYCTDISHLLDSP